MPSQAKIINAVNRILNKKSNIDFELNKSGICAGLAGLFIKYTLENKARTFFASLDSLANLPMDYQLGDNAALDDFIIQIERTYRPSNYYGSEIRQGDLAKILTIDNKLLANELNLGLVTNEASWEEIFKKISRDKRLYQVCSEDHAVSVSFNQGQYIVYDPNYNKKFTKFDSAKDLIEELKKCFDFQNDSFGLTINAFAHPNAKPEVYPTHEELHQIAFAKDTPPLSSFFASATGDIATLNYLFKENKIVYSALSREYARKEFNQLLLKQAPSAPLKKALLDSINSCIILGYCKEAEASIAYYIKFYKTKDEYNELKNYLQIFFNQPKLTLLKKQADYGSLLKSLDSLSLIKYPIYETKYNHLKLLTFIDQNANIDTISQFLNTLSSVQLLNQIQCCAITNQHHILNLLANHLSKNQLDLKLFPSLFTKEVINEMTATTFTRLLNMGFEIDVKAPELLSLCMNRKDKTIFILYANAWAKQNQIPNLELESPQNPPIDLNTTLGTIPLLNALIYLNKNEQIKKAWKEDLAIDTIKGALVTAIVTGNKEIRLFLQSKLPQNSPYLEEDTLEFLYKKGLEEEDFSLISTVFELNFNMLRNIKDILPLLKLCIRNEDYSIIERGFKNARPDVQQQIFKYCLTYHITSLLKICLQQKPDLALGLEPEKLEQIQNFSPKSVRKKKQDLILDNSPSMSPNFRYSFSNNSFKKALEEVNTLFEECQNIIEKYYIDLKQSIDNKEVINKLAQIKSLLAEHNISPYYLSEEHTQLLEQLIQNPRVKSVCELELTIYTLPKSATTEFDKALQSMQKCLKEAKLPAHFVIPSIQAYLAKAIIADIKEEPLKSSAPELLHTLKSHCYNALSNYLNHRDTTLSTFSYYFDYARGQTRANHYLNLIKAANTEQELDVIVYALLVNNNGIQLKKDMANGLGYSDEHSALKAIKFKIQHSHSAESLAQLDKVIETINLKINLNDETATEVLFHEELDYLSPKNALRNHSLFQPEKQNKGFWHWIAQCLGFVTPTKDVNRLSLT